MGAEEPEAVRADAHRVIDWYRRELSARTHDLAFTASALADAQTTQTALREEVAAVRGELDELIERIEGAPVLADTPDPHSEHFAAWVARNWDAIEDAHLAHAVEHCARPAAAQAP